MSTDAPKLYPMKGGAARFPSVAIYNERQEKALGQLLAAAISQGRAFQVRQPPDGSKEILVLTSKADDLGHVFRINLRGHIDDIGVTDTGRFPSE